MTKENSTGSKPTEKARESPGESQAARRQRLAELLGRLLARVWLQRQAEPAEPATDDEPGDQDR